MASFCAELKTKDLQAFNLCRQLEAEGSPLKELDLGVFRLDYKDPDRPKRISEGSGDGKISPQEVYQRYLELTFQEERSRSRKNPKNASTPAKFSPRYLRAWKDQTSLSVPFVFDDLNPETSEDEALFKTCLQAIVRIQKTLGRENLVEETPEYRKRLATELFHFIQDPKKKGGLGIRFAADAKRGDRNLSGIVAAREATCLEFVLLYSALARLAGLDTAPIEVFRNGQGYLEEHVQIAVPLDPDHSETKLFFDIEKGMTERLDEKQFSPLSDLEIWAYYFNDSYIGAQDHHEQETFLQQALRFSPHQYMVLNNYGHWLLNNGGKLEKALELFLKAGESNPQYPFIFRGLAVIYEAQGKKQKAEAATKRAEELFKPRLPKEQQPRPVKN